MLALIKLFFSIAILGKGPQDVPYSRFLFVALLVVLFIADLISNQLLASSGEQLDMKKLILFLVLANVIVYGLTYLLVYVHGFANRAIQTMTALLGVELIIMLAQLPIFILLPLFAQNKGILVLLYYITMGWELVANVHIYRHALQISAVRAALITLVLFSLQIYLVVKFFPEGS
jgi:hypothetical protein